MTPPFFFSFNARPASESLVPKTLRAPKFAPTSQICNLAFEPAAASVKGSSGDHTAENTSPCADKHHHSSARGYMKTHQSEIATGDEADLSLPTCLVPLNVPYFYHFVRARRCKASADMRIDVQSTRCAIVGRDGEARGRWLVDIR